MRTRTRFGMVAAVGVLLTSTLWAWAAPDSVQSSKRTPLSFRLATTSPARGFDILRVGESTFYVGTRGALSGSDVVSAEAIAVRGGSDLALTLTAEASRRLAGAMRTYGVDHLVAFVDGKLMGAGALMLNASTGQASLSRFSSSETRRLTSLINIKHPKLAGPTILVTADQTALPVGGSTRVSVYLIGRVADLQAYQMSLAATGGDSGRLALSDVVIDDSQPDFVFAGLQKLGAADQTGKRFGATLYSGGIDTARRTYLGSATVTPTADATGSFTVGLRDPIARSVLLTGSNEKISYLRGRPLVITVGSPGAKSPTGR